MSIQQQVKIEALEKRIEALEIMVKQLHADVHASKPEQSAFSDHNREILSLKRA